jgi:hypothetical protein
MLLQASLTPCGTIDTRCDATAEIPWRQYRRSKARFGDCARHAPNGGGRLVLDKDGAATIDEAGAADQTVAAHSAEDHSEGVLAVNFADRPKHRSTDGRQLELEGVALSFT